MTHSPVESGRLWPMPIMLFADAASDAVESADADGIQNDGNVRNPFEDTLGRIVTDIRSGATPNGSRLPAERDLAEQLGVSRSTIRAVIRALQQAGVVRTEKGRSGGSFVTWERAGSVAGLGLDGHMAARLKDLLRFRSVLEPGAAGLAAERDLTTQERKRLIELLEAATTSGPGFRGADAELHVFIAELADCQALRDAIENVQLVLTGTLLQIVPLMGPALAHSHRFHAALVDAILVGDPTKAREVMSDHVAATAQLLHGFLD